MLDLPSARAILDLPSGGPEYLLTQDPTLIIRALCVHDTTVCIHTHTYIYIYVSLSPLSSICTLLDSLVNPSSKANTILYATGP